MILFTRELIKAGIPTITLQGILITRPTIQYLSPQRVAIHFLMTTQDDYALYQKSITDPSKSTAMPPAHHILLLAAHTNDMNLYAALRKRTKVAVECINTTYQFHDCHSQLFTIRRLLAVHLTVKEDQ